MGKRKSSAKPQAKVKQVLDTTFQCLFCNHEKSIICTLDKRNSIGQLHCKICGQTFQTPLNSLSQPVDVYSDWVDACEAVAEEYEKNKTSKSDNEEENEKGENYADDDDEDDYA